MRIIGATFYREDQRFTIFESDGKYFYLGPGAFARRQPVAIAEFEEIIRNERPKCDQFFHDVLEMINQDMIDGNASEEL